MGNRNESSNLPLHQLFAAPTPSAWLHGKIFVAIFIAMGMFWSGNLFSKPLPPPCPSTVIFVDSAATGSQSGNSWADALVSLQDALDSARTCAVETIFVAKGTYFPDRNTGAPDSSFSLIDGLKIYGGYPTGGGARDISANPTILSGDIGVVGDNSDNAFHVVNARTVGRGTVLDGFIITLGNAQPALDNGGGLIVDSSDPHINNCIFLTNNGGLGGAVNIGGGSKPVFYNCEFLSNTSFSKGAAVYNLYSAPVFVNCLFEGNFSQTDGGAMAGSNSPATLVNSIFHSNTCFGSGGGLYNDTCAVNVVNCTFTQNTCFTQGGGTFNIDSDPLFANSIFWNNSNGFGAEMHDLASTTEVYNCIIQGGYAGTGTGTGVLNINPQFVNPPTDLSLQQLSPALNYGLNSFLMPDSVDADLDGDSTEVLNEINDVTRVRLYQVDLGALEFVGEYAIYVDSSATGANDGSSWADAFTDLQDACSLSVWTDSILVAKGTYYPDGGTGARDSSFHLIRGTVVMGGYPSGGSGPAGRDFAQNQTLIDGDLGVAGDTSDNSFHLVSISGADSSCILDGFILQNGNADQLSSPDNYGAAIAIDAASPTIRQCIFRKNVSRIFGGAVDIRNGGQPHFYNCLFQNNEASFGGAVYVRSADPVFVNNTFYGNSAVFPSPGAIEAESNANPQLVNCLLWANVKSLREDATSTITVSHSLVENGWPGTANLDTTPVFVMAPSNLRVKVCSPVVDAGDASVVATLVDLDGNPRIQNSTVDIGAYELQSSPVPAPNPEFSGDTTYFCQLFPALLDPDQNSQYPGASFVWSSGDTTRTVVGNVPGNFIVTITDTNSCIGIDSTFLVQRNAPNPQLGQDQTICTSDSLELNPGSYVNYLWSTGDTTSNIRVTLADTFIVTVTDTNNCQNSDTVIIANYPEPQPDVTAPDGITVCRNTSVYLESDGGWAEYLWNTGDTTQSIAVDTSGLYEVVVTDSIGCSGMDTITVNYLPVLGPTADITANGPVVFCEGDSVLLDAGQGFFSYRWSDGDTTQFNVVDTTQMNWVRVTNGFGCVGASDTINTVMNFNPDPDVTLFFGFNGDPDTLLASQAVSYQWYMNNQTLVGETDQELIPQISGDFQVMVVDSNGCIGVSDSVSLMLSLGVDNPLGGILLYPNPSNGKVYLESTDSWTQPLELQILNPVGQLIAQESFPYLRGKRLLDLEYLSSGVYFLKLTSGEHSQTIRLIRR